MHKILFKNKVILAQTYVRYAMILGHKHTTIEEKVDVNAGNLKIVC